MPVYQFYNLMNNLLICDNCREPFDIVPKTGSGSLPPIGGRHAALDIENKRVPLVLRRCGHTVCSLCISEVLAAHYHKQDEQQ